MLLLIILIVVLAVTIALSIYLDNRCDTASFLSAVLATVTFIAVILLGFGIICENIESKGKTDALKQRYDSLYYQASHNLYDNDNDVGKKELADQITKWNEEIAKGTVLHNNIWVSALHPVDYDQFWLIPIELLDGSK